MLPHTRLQIRLRLRCVGPAFLVLAILAWAPGCGAPSPAKMPDRVLVVGHRGAPRLAAENTVPSIRKAYELGADGVELDLCLTKDGQVILWHDADPDGAIALVRGADLEGMPFAPTAPDVGAEMRRPVIELTLAEMRRHYGYAPESWRIPTLAEAMEAIADRENPGIVIFDIKDLGNATLIYDRIVAATERHRLPAQARVIASTVSAKSVALLHDRASRYPDSRVRIALDVEAGADVEALDPRVKVLGLGYVLGQPWSDYLYALKDVLVHRDKGRLDLVYAWTLTEPESMREALRLGINGLITNDVEAALSARRSMLDSKSDR